MSLLKVVKSLPDESNVGDCVIKALARLFDFAEDLFQ